MKIKNSKKYFGAFLICLFACLMVCLCSGFSVKLPEKQGRYSASYGDDAMLYSSTVTDRIVFRFILKLVLMLTLAVQWQAQ